MYVLRHRHENRQLIRYSWPAAQDAYYRRFRTPDGSIPWDIFYVWADGMSVRLDPRTGAITV